MSIHHQSKTMRERLNTSTLTCFYKHTDLREISK